MNEAPDGRARLVMRQKGNLRLLLNAALWPQMQFTLMDGGQARLVFVHDPVKYVSLLYDVAVVLTMNFISCKNLGRRSRTQASDE